MVRVLVCSTDAALSDLLARNLARRGFRARQEAWAPCCGAPAAVSEAADVIIGDLDCPEPACWRGATRLREMFPSLPVVFLSHAWPDAARLRLLQPCRYVHTPVAVGELLRALRELVSTAS